MKPIKKSPAKQGKSKINLNDTSLPSQRKRMLKRLRQKPVTTVDARDQLNVMAPAARVFELKHDHGLNIITTWVTATDSAGRRHKMAEYILLLGKWQGGKK